MTYRGTTRRVPASFAYRRSTIPRFAHCANHSGPLSRDTAQQLSQFPLLTVEKTQGAADPNHTDGKYAEDRIVAALAQAKEHNPSQLSLLYLNTLLDFPYYRLYETTMANPDMLLKDMNGDRVIFRGNPVFDLRRNDTRNAWLDTVRYAMTKAPGHEAVDGVFGDRGRGSAFVDLKHFKLTNATREAWDRGHLQLLADAQALIDELSPGEGGGILVLNGRDMPGVNGRMYENFTWDDSRAVPPGDDLAILQKEWPWHYPEAQHAGNSDTSIGGAGGAGLGEGPNRVAEVHSDDCPSGYSGKYNVTLAAFLVGASNRSYYACTESWACKGGWLDPRAEYSQPLGLPKGPPTRELAVGHSADWDTAGVPGSGDESDGTGGGDAGPLAAAWGGEASCGSLAAAMPREGIEGGSHGWPMDGAAPVRFRREFGTGTVAYLQQEGGSEQWVAPCILWSSGFRTGAAADCAAYECLEKARVWT